MYNLWIEADKQLPPLDTYVLMYYSEEYTSGDENWIWEKSASRYIVGVFTKADDGRYLWLDEETHEDLIAPSHWMMLPEAPDAVPF